MAERERERTSGGEADGDGRRIYRVPLSLEPQPEGGYTVTSPAVPGLVTEGETVAESLEHAWDALLCLLEGYEESGRTPPLTASIANLSGS